MWCAANAKSYVSGDNSSVVATDSVKNACLLAAKSLAQPASCEDFAVAVATDLVARYPGMHTRCVVQVSEVPWVRVAEGGTPHEHGFVRCTAGGERFCEADARAEHGMEGMVRVTSGVRELRVLKTTKSGWEGFVRDGLTLLPDTSERMLASAVTARWTYGNGARTFKLGSPLPAVARDPAVGCYDACAAAVVEALKQAFYGPARGGKYSPGVQATLYDMGAAALKAVPGVEAVTLAMPNLHFNPLRLPKPVDVQFDDDIFVPVDEPHGQIEATVQRPKARM